MNEIVWLSHGGPGSGRYPKGSGKNPRAGKIIINKEQIINFSKKKRKKSEDRPHTDYNVDKWGKDKDSNILFITGIAGSGKSTLARKYTKKENAEYINIDLYTFKTANKYIKDMSSSFNKYLDKNVPSWKKLQKEGYAVLTKNDRRAQKAAGKWFDIFESALLGYGKEEYGRKKVVAEGVQILDETLFYKNKKALEGKPLIIMDTSIEESIISRAIRDNKSINKLLEPERKKQLEGWINDLLELKRIVR